MRDSQWTLVSSQIFQGKELRKLHGSLRDLEEAQVVYLSLAISNSLHKQKLKLGKTFQLSQL